VKGLFSSACPIPCTKSELFFGFPFKAKDGKDAYGKFYFKSAGHRQLAFGSFAVYILIIRSSTSIDGIMCLAFCQVYYFTLF
jgi:hypothetical protein